VNDTINFVDAQKIETSLRMLRAHLDEAELGPFITALEALKQAPQDQASLVRLDAAFKELKALQGAVLTYAPYVGFLLISDPFESDPGTDDHA
jgi:hypothetical protein